MSKTNLLYHIVIRTKANIPAISTTHEKDLYSYIWNFLKLKKCYLHRIGGMPDHIHLLINIPPSLSLASVIHDLKICANRYIGRNKKLFPFFDGWGREYYANTVTHESLASVTEYIKGQKEHHKRISLMQELIEWMDSNGIEYDRRYIFSD